MENLIEIVEIKYWNFKVRSFSNKRRWHEVIHKVDGSYFCTCKNYKYSTNECKHITSVKEFIE